MDQQLQLPLSRVRPITDMAKRPMALGPIPWGCKDHSLAALVASNVKRVMTERREVFEPFWPHREPASLMSRITSGAGWGAVALLAATALAAAAN